MLGWGHLTALVLARLVAGLFSDCPYHYWVSSPALPWPYHPLQPAARSKACSLLSDPQIWVPHSHITRASCFVQAGCRALFPDCYRGYGGRGAGSALLFSLPQGWLGCIPTTGSALLCSQVKYMPVVRGVCWGEVTPVVPSEGRG